MTKQRLMKHQQKSSKLTRGSFGHDDTPTVRLLQTHLIQHVVMSINNGRGSPSDVEVPGKIKPRDKTIKYRSEKRILGPSTAGTVMSV